MLKVKLCPNLINKDIDHLFMQNILYPANRES